VSESVVAIFSYEIMFKVLLLTCWQVNHYVLL